MSTEAPWEGTRCRAAPAWPNSLGWRTWGNSSSVLACRPTASVSLWNAFMFFSNDLKENSLTKFFYLCDPTGPPAFETLLSDCTTKTGETIKLTCKVTGSPKPVVSWLKGRDIRHGVLQNIQSNVLFHLTLFLMVSTCKDGLPLEDDPRHIISADRAGSCCLILDSLTAQDAGQYTCYASSFMGSAATLAKVVVQGESCFCRVKMPRFC